MDCQLLILRGEGACSTALVLYTWEQESTSGVGNPCAPHHPLNTAAMHQSRRDTCALGQPSHFLRLCWDKRLHRRANRSLTEWADAVLGRFSGLNTRWVRVESVPTMPSCIDWTTTQPQTANPRIIRAYVHEYTALLFLVWFWNRRKLWGIFQQLLPHSWAVA